MMMGNGGVWYWLGWALPWVIVVLGLIAAMWALRGSSLLRETPVEILKRRYARGEMDADQFEKMKRQLQENG